MADVTIEVLKDGPLWVEPADAINLIDHEGNAIPIPQGKKGIVLCRCGGSVKKPFCDGTHSKIGFQGARKAVEESEEAE